jgi:hypothetical protein
METITANEIKTKGVASIQACLATELEAAITVRGKKQFVVMEMAHFQYLRECELEAALLEAQRDLKNNNFVIESVSDHLARIKHDI